MNRHVRLLACALALALTCLLAARAHAQSCCGVASEDELSVVVPHRRAVLTTRLATKHMLGRHDSAGEYQPLADGVSATDFQLVLGGGVRMPFYDRLQVHGSLPLRAQLRSLPRSGGGQDDANELGLGDASAYLRWSALYDDERGVLVPDASFAPHLDLFAGVKTPSGVYDDGPSVDALARTMGDGSWGLSFGARAIKYLAPQHAARLSLRYMRRFARDADASLTGYEAFWPGDQLGITASYLGLSGMRWLFGITADVVFTLPASARMAGGEERTLSGTAMRETTLGMQLTRVLVMPHVDLTLGLAYTLPLPQLSRNVSWEGLQAGLTLRYHVMQ